MSVRIRPRLLDARLVELVDAPVLETGPERGGGSTPPVGTLWQTQMTLIIE